MGRTTPRDTSAAIASALVIAVGLARPVAAQEPWLHLVGEPYADGAMTASIYAPSSAGSSSLIVLGADPLPLQAPIVTGKGPLYMGQILLVLDAGPIPAGGWLHIPFTMPPEDPLLLGLHVPVQGYVPGALTNPATLPIDAPYYEWAVAQTITAPVPGQGAAFGDRTASGDLNDDGFPDLVVGAWAEKYLGIFHSGRVYVMWGPDFTMSTALSPPVPQEWGSFGAGIAVSDLDGDGISDLAVGDGVGDPPAPGAVGTLRVYKGGPSFADTVAASIPSDQAVGTYGRALVVADFDDDGHADLAVGLPLASQASWQNAGRIDVLWGPDHATSRSAITSPDPGPFAYFGLTLLSADVDGDGLFDLVESSSMDDVGGTTNLGSVHVFLAPDFATGLTIANPNPQGFNSRFGSAIAASDFNGDGRDDLVVTDEKGNAYVFWAPDFTTYFRMRRPPQAGGVSYGYFAAVGDANGDGLDDIAFSNVFGGPTGGGQAFVLLGPYFATYLHQVDPSGTPGDEFGWSLQFTDLDLDGRNEWLVGSDLADSAGVPGAGKVTRFRP